MYPICSLEVINCNITFKCHQVFDSKWPTWILIKFLCIKCLRYKDFMKVLFPQMLQTTQLCAPLRNLFSEKYVESPGWKDPAELLCVSHVPTLVSAFTSGVSQGDTSHCHWSQSGGGEDCGDGDYQRTSESWKHYPSARRECVSSFIFPFLFLAV